MGESSKTGYAGKMSGRLLLLVSISTSLLPIGLIVGCQTSRLREFEDVRLGMAKDQVLATVGGPNRTVHRNGIDRWTYFLWKAQDGGRKVSEVHFSDGIAVYVGAPTPPKISAEEQDQINSGSLVERFEKSSVFEVLGSTPTADDKAEKTSR